MKTGAPTKKTSRCAMRSSWSTATGNQTTQTGRKVSFMIKNAYEAMIKSGASCTFLHHAHAAWRCFGEGSGHGSFPFMAFAAPHGMQGSGSEVAS